jgi:PilZ domain-containing protein
MPNDISVLVADPQHVSVFRDRLHLSGRVLRFASTNLATAFESIKTNQPRLVAVDGAFAERAEGRAFIDRVSRLAIDGTETRLVAEIKGAWATTPLPAQPAPPPAVDAKNSGINTRRAPRFLVLDPLQAVVESHKASLVDLSVLGAQVVSEPVLRPNQKLKVALPDTNNQTLRLTAHVAWSLYERPKHAAEPYYRAGMEFTDASREALEDFCRRHCSEDPLPYRSKIKN